MRLQHLLVAAKDHLHFKSFQDSQAFSPVAPPNSTSVLASFRSCLGEDFSIASSGRKALVATLR